MALLEIRNIAKDFGGLRVLNGVDLDVRRGEILGIIGPNGAGKTTLFNVVTGFHKPTSGQVVFDGRKVTGLRPDQIASAGLVRTFQATALFKEFSIIDNMRSACHLGSKVSFWGALLNSRHARRREAELRRRALDLLSFVGLDSRADEIAENLSYGYQRTLCFAAALATEPKMLLLDEPVCALNPDRVLSILALIRKIRDAGTTVVLIEHNMRVIFGLCDRIVVLNAGSVIAEGTAAEIRDHPEVIRAYLGDRRDAS